MLMPPWAHRPSACSYYSSNLPSINFLQAAKTPNLRSMSMSFQRGPEQLATHLPTVRPTPCNPRTTGSSAQVPVALTASAGSLAQTLKPMPISALSLSLTSQQHSQNFFSFFSQTYLYREGSCDLIILGTLHLLMPGQSAK